MKALLYISLILLVLNASFSYPKAACNNNAKPQRSCMTKHSCCPSASPVNKTTKDKQPVPCKVCNFCPMCLVFVVPVKQKAQRDFVSISGTFPELAQGKPTGYNPSCWRPPNSWIVNGTYLWI